MYRLGDLKLQQHFTVAHHSDKLLRVYWRIFVKIFVSAAEFYHSNKLHKLYDLIFCDMLLRQNSVAETKIFIKIVQYKQSDLLL